MSAIVQSNPVPQSCGCACLDRNALKKNLKLSYLLSFASGFVILGGAVLLLVRLMLGTRDTWQ